MNFWQSFGLVSLLFSSGAWADKLSELRFYPQAYGGRLAAPIIQVEASLSSPGDIRLGGRTYRFSQLKSAFNPGSNQYVYEIFNTDFKPSYALVFINEEIWFSQSFESKLFHLKEPGVVSKGQELPKTFGLSGDQVKATEPSTRVAWQLPSEIQVKSFRVCFFEETALIRKTLCHEPTDTTTPLRFLVNEQSIADRGSVALEQGVLDVAYFNQGISFQLETKAPIPKPEFYELTVNGPTLNMTYYGAPPASTQFTTWSQRLPISLVAGTDEFKEENRIYYRVQSPLLAPFLNIQGPDGLAISYAVNLTSAPPTEAARLRVKPPVYVATYANQIPLKLEYVRPDQASNYQVRSKEVAYDSKNQTWLASAPDKYKLNQPKIELLQRNGRVTPLDYALYRAPSTFISSRLGASTDGVGLSVSGEAEVKHWFEAPLGEWSRQRLGLVAQGLSQSTLVAQNPAQFQMFSLDGVYRFTPGVSNWDPSWAIGFGALQYNYSDYISATSLGGSILYTAPAPKLLSYSLGFLPFARKPKWSEWQVGYYMLPISTGYHSQVFTGKATARIDISEKFYWEAGWSFESVQIQNVSRPSFILGLVSGRFLLGLGGRF